MNFSILLFLVVVGCLESATPSGNFDGVLSVFTKSIQAQNVEGAMKLLDDGLQFRTCAKTMTKDRIRSIFEEFVKKANPSKFELSPLKSITISTRKKTSWRMDVSSHKLASRDFYLISDLFTPTFELRTCDYVFDRDQTADIISSLREETKITVLYKSEERLGSTMQYKWQLTGLGTKGADVVVYARYQNKFWPQISSMTVVSC
ncbi:hypothetical protein L5515_019486 [Caenorhabditis briggsae]|uniref:NTF2-like domain-containing protein n=1 Tax=Caenorhabditis briggsae TaxID=6238 RepID=A0AAE9FEU9_CAEBR|nr:hypothetical protein L5515_019486 [Caenorhabditis briggsae]